VVGGGDGGVVALEGLCDAVVLPVGVLCAEEMREERREGGREAGGREGARLGPWALISPLASLAPHSHRKLRLAAIFHLLIPPHPTSLSSNRIGSGRVVSHIVSQIRTPKHVRRFLELLFLVTILNDLLAVLPLVSSYLLFSLFFNIFGECC
jgi:hypothetical protein